MSALRIERVTGGLKSRGPSPAASATSSQADRRAGRRRARTTSPATRADAQSEAGSHSRRPRASIAPAEDLVFLKAKRVDLSEVLGPGHLDFLGQDCLRLVGRPAIERALPIAKVRGECAAGVDDGAGEVARGLQPRGDRWALEVVDVLDSESPAGGGECHVFRPGCAWRKHVARASSREARSTLRDYSTKRRGRQRRRSATRRSRRRASR